MNRKILWTIAIVVLAIYLFFWHSYVKPFDFSDFIESIDFISTVLTALILSFIFALLIALVPAKNKIYKSRLMFSFPISLILICIIFGLAFYSIGPHYYAIKTEPHSECASVHKGLFHSGDLLIERNGALQIQTNTKTKEQERFAVTWLTDCEYQLSSMNEIVKVKIVSVDQDGYDCYVWYNGRTSKRIKVMRQDNTH